MPAHLTLVADRARPAPVTLAARPWVRICEQERDCATARLAAPLIRFNQDQEIYGEGDVSDTVYKLMSGVVRTCKFLSDGRRQIEAFLLPGDLVGLEMGDTRSLSAEAVTDCTLAAYRRRSNDALSLEDETLNPQLLAYAMRSLSRARAHMLLLGRRSALEKVATFLVGWAERAHDDQCCSLPMTRQDMADYLGLTIETVSRTLSLLERKRLIELPSAREIRLKDRAALKDLNS